MSTPETTSTATGNGGAAVEHEAVRKALQEGRLEGHETLKAQARLTIPEIGLDVPIDGTIELE